MRKFFEKYLILLSAVILTGCGSDDFNWSKTFESDSTEPIGTYILRKELPEIFPKSEITDIKNSTYDYFYYDEPQGGNYFYIHNDTYELTNPTWEQILRFVNNGGSAFVSAYVYQPEFSDSLQFSTKNPGMMAEKESVRFTVKKAEGEANFIFNGKAKNKAYFSKFNPEYTEVLGYADFGKSREPNFIKIYYGKGYVLLHSEPVVFSNYEMLQKDHFRYVNDVFSYLDDSEIHWDNYRTYRRNRDYHYNNGGFFSSLSFIMKHKSLKMAFLTLLALGVLYLIFNSKRKQRAQEVILPYSNYTLDFTKTLSELYRYNSDHTALTKYKINYFLEQLRLSFHITAKDTEKDFTDLLSAKSGVDRKFCQELVSTLNGFRTRNYLNKQDFIKIRSLTESFNRKIKLNGRESGT